MKKLILCRVWSGVAVKRTGDKWMVTREEFSDDVYPDYCSGTAILYSQVQNLTNARIFILTHSIFFSIIPAFSYSYMNIYEVP
jgi:hypothetical protein